jgi:hypothetical protein
MLTFETLEVDSVFNIGMNLMKISNGLSSCVAFSYFVQNCLEDIKNFEVYEDDIWIVSNPKSG